VPDEDRSHLTELETAILAVIWRRGPCSAYSVQREFAESPTARWSSSTGSIYPALKRLARGDYLSIVEQPWGKSTKSVFSLSEAGRKALANWVVRLEETGGPSYDPIRTRLYFLDILAGPDERLAFIAAATERTRDELERMENLAGRLQQQGPLVEYLAVIGAVLELKARIDWLMEAGIVLSSDAGSAS
jgi:DNA-binding PadR family transcriptional regulator